MYPLAKRPSVWLLPLFLVVALVYLFSYTEMELVRGSSQAALAAASTTLLFSCLLSSLSAAVESSRENLSRGVLDAVSRSYFERVFFRLWPSVTAGVIVQFTSVIILLLNSKVIPQLSDGLILFGYVLAITAHAAFGNLLGQWFHGRFAIPLALVGSYLFLAFTGTSSFFPLHYLSGMTLNGCCMAAQNIDFHAIWALVVFSALSTTGFIILAGTNRPLERKRISASLPSVHIATGTLLILASVATGLWLGKDLEGIPAVAMSDEQFECSNTRPQVCLNQVQLSGGDRRMLVAQSITSLTKVGFPEPQRVTASMDTDLTVEEDGVLLTSFEPSYTDEQVVYAAASSYASQLANQLCDSDDFDQQYAMIQLLQEWSTGYAQEQVLGIPSGGLEQPLASLNRDEQQIWALRAYDSLTRCEVPAKPGKDS